MRLNISKIAESFIKSDRIKKILEKLREDKKVLLILLLSLLGVVLIAFSEFDTDSSAASEVDAQLSGGDSECAESKLENIIKKINGVGDVAVYITYDCEYETVYAVNSEKRTDNDSEDTKTEYIITDKDTGLVLKTVYPKVRGVAVICQGGNDPVVKEKIYSIVSALFEISSNKISVADME